MPDYTARRGCQDFSTGLLGSLFILTLVCACGDFRMTLSGPLVLEQPFPWLPRTGIEAVNREPFSLLASLALGVLFMATWDLAPRRQRNLLIIGMLTAAVLPWMASLAGGSPWVDLGWCRVSRLEAGLLGSGAVLGALAFLVALPWWRRTPRESTRRTLRTSFWRWLAGLCLFSAVLAVTVWTPLYVGGFYEIWRFTCCTLFSVYLFLGLPYAFVTNLRRPGYRDNLADPGFVLCLLARSRRRARVMRMRGVRVTLLDLVVKMFFIPVMTISFFLNMSFLFRAFVYQPADGGYVFLTRNVYAFVFGAVGTMDISLGLLGYLCASRWLGNKSVSVDPSVIGWLVTLLCYPPLNAWTVSRLPLQEGAAVAPNVDLTLQIVALGAFVVYAASIMAFGLRFSNLTHRGIVEQGPYALVRHPAYASKIIGWWAESARNLDSLSTVLVVVFVDVLYVLRALTEERHLQRFEDYRAYCARVRYRFIPWVI